MNIVHVICSLRTGGAELMLIDIANAQASLGHNVSLIVINNELEQDLLNALVPSVRKVFIRRPEGSKNPWWIMKYNLSLRRLRPHAVHFHHNAAAAMTVGCRRISIATAHTTSVPLSHFSKLRKVVAISPAVRQSIASRSEAPTSVILNGIDCDSIKTAGQLNQFQIVQVARLRSDVKGQDLLIKAVAQLRAKGIPLSLHLIGEGPSRPQLEELVQELGLESHVTFLGNRSRQYVYDHLCNYGLSVLPSRVEGFGLSVAEAMAAKVPVLVSNLQGPLSVICDGRFGTSFESESGQALAQAIEHIMNHYPTYQALAAGPAYDYCVANFGIRKTVDAYIQEYKNL